VRGFAKPNHFKRHPSEWGAKKVHTLRKTIRGEYKVECKKWSAKGKCRKASAEGECSEASADKEHTLGLKHARWLRPRADSCLQVPTAKFRNRLGGFWNYQNQTKTFFF
jgi:hypothetical protein